MPRFKKKPLVIIPRFVCDSGMVKEQRIAVSKIAQHANQVAILPYTISPAHWPKKKLQVNPRNKEKSLTSAGFEPTTSG